MRRLPPHGGHAPGSRGGSARAASAPGRSESSFVVKRCPSEIRSTSTAIESIACSIRSSRCDHLGRRPSASRACVACAAMYASVSGMPSAERRWT